MVISILHISLYTEYVEPPAAPATIRTDQSGRSFTGIAVGFFLTSFAAKEVQHQPTVFSVAIDLSQKSRR